MISSSHFASIEALDLRAIARKLTHPEAGEGWSQEKTVSVEKEYRRFLYLMKMFPEEQTAPSVEVDTFWHYHILDTMKYGADCQRAFGYFLHHNPYIGLRGVGDEAVLQCYGERMAELYEQTFGEEYGEHASAFCPSKKPTGASVATSAWCSATATSAWCSATTVRTNSCRAPATHASFGSATRPAFCSRTIVPRSTPKVVGQAHG